jgi:uncharacterized iron-regulated membrane protein
MAAFLVVTGLTGAIISWDHELDEWLNGHLLHSATPGQPQNPLALAAAAEARHPQVQVTHIPLAAEPGHSLALWVEARPAPGGERLLEPGYNQIFLDPVTGAEQGRREWGAVWPLSRENAVSFLYKLHFSLHIPEFWGNDRWGIWLLGAIALLWTLDCFTGLVLTLPGRRRKNAALQPGPAERRSWWTRWAIAWKVRWRGSTYQINFDLHRAGSLWTWALLLILAFTAFSLNLYREVFFPAMSLVSQVTPSPFETRAPVPAHRPIAPTLDFARSLELARAEAARRGWAEPAGSIYYAREYGFYAVEFFHPEDEHGAGGVGHKRLYLDGHDGHLLGDRLPWQGSAADLFVQAQFPLHSGRILGLPGRILISAMGLVVAGLSLTGVYIWWRKRRGRRLRH